jgi:hypothetical protein
VAGDEERQLFAVCGAIVKKGVVGFEEENWVFGRDFFVCLVFFFFFLLIICVLRGGCESVKGVEYERLKERASVWGCCWLPWSCGAATGVVYSRGCY